MKSLFLMWCVFARLEFVLLIVYFSTVEFPREVVNHFS